MSNRIQEFHSHERAVPLYPNARENLHSRGSLNYRDPQPYSVDYELKDDDEPNYFAGSRSRSPTFLLDEESNEEDTGFNNCRPTSCETPRNSRTIFPCRPNGFRMPVFYWHLPTPASPGHISPHDDRRRPDFMTSIPSNAHLEEVYKALFDSEERKGGELLDILARFWNGSVRYLSEVRNMAQLEMDVRALILVDEGFVRGDGREDSGFERLRIIG